MIKRPKPQGYTISHRGTSLIERVISIQRRIPFVVTYFIIPVVKKPIFIRVKLKKKGKF